MSSFLPSSIQIFKQYKTIAEKAIEQVKDDALFITHKNDENSIAIIMQHLSGNMLSRWTDFLTSDGEKDWRNRDAEFENLNLTRAMVFINWEKGWSVFISSLDGLSDSDLNKTVFIRKEPHTVTEAINRQMAHYAYHIGQIVLLCKTHKTTEWKSLSIPKNGSNLFNSEKMRNS